MIGIISILALGLLGASVVAHAQVPKPNVVILLTDDQGTLDAGCYGSTDLKTPNMDKLAASGIRFTQAYAELPMPRQAYARVISSVDEQIGRVLDKLEATGLRDNTIVIMMSDNGHSTENSAGITVENHSSG